MNNSIKKFLMKAGKLKNYRDVRFLWHVWRTALKIDSTTKEAKLPWINIEIRRDAKASQNSVEKIRRYVSMCLTLRRWLGYKDTCLIRSLLLCRILREAGINAKVNFGTKTAVAPSLDGWTLDGHCWVTIDEEELKTDYAFVFQHP